MLDLGSFDGLALDLLRQTGQREPPYCPRRVAALLGARVTVDVLIRRGVEITTPDRIFVDRTVDHLAQRFAIAHGCGHIALEVRVTGRTCRPGRVFDHNGEESADTLAMRVLVPDRDLGACRGFTIEAMATLFQVPLWVARRRRLQHVSDLDLL